MRCFDIVASISEVFDVCCYECQFVFSCSITPLVECCHLLVMIRRSSINASVIEVFVLFFMPTVCLGSFDRTIQRSSLLMVRVAISVAMSRSSIVAGASQ